MTDNEFLEEQPVSEETKDLDRLSEEQAGELLEILLNTREQSQMVEQLIKSQINVKDEMINKLHNELDYYKKGTADRFTDQLMKAVIKVRKDMGRQLSAPDFETMPADDLRREYRYIFEDLTDLLEQQNVDPYSSAAGDDFDPAIHQPKLEATDDESLDKKVKQSISEGYKKGDKVLLPERVIVYQFKN